MPWVKEAYENKKYAFATDYIRLYALHTEGGIYLDADVQVLKDFLSSLTHQSFMGYETSGDFEPAIIGAQAGVEWIGKCLDYLKIGIFTSMTIHLIYVHYQALLKTS
ncbi:MAG: hypothetical protein LBS09_04990 [Bacteroidales bacterium]|nr:hypothetical protein [Bacteroidales bacterium]